MKKMVLFALVMPLVVASCPPHAGEPARDPALATVRIKSHGCSATIIATTEGRSWILGCAHMLADKNGRPSAAERARRFYIDGPVQTGAVRSKATGPATLVKWDYQADLSLLVIDNGPFHHVPVAPSGFKPGRKILSVGYDNMKWPITVRHATIQSSDESTTYTAEKPWHGRSGGGLIDADAGFLIGVVQGYEVAPFGSRGIYVSHQAIVRFLSGVRELAPNPQLPEPPPGPHLPPHMFPCPS